LFGSGLVVELWVVWVCGGLLVVLGLFLCLEGFSRYGLFEKVVFRVFPFDVIVFPFFPSLHLFFAVLLRLVLGLFDCFSDQKWFVLCLSLFSRYCLFG